MRNPTRGTGETIDFIQARVICTISYNIIFSYFGNEQRIQKKIDKKMRITVNKFHFNINLPQA